MAGYIDIQQEAKSLYGISAAKEMCEHWGEKFTEHNLKINCRFHNDTNPSWVWNSKEHYFKCFACGKTYGIIDFYIDELGMNYWKALKKLCDNVGLEFNFNNDSYKHKVKDNHKYPVKDEHDRVEAENYLQRRGISIKTMDYADIGADINGNIAFNFYDITGKLIGVKYRKRYKVEKGDYRYFWQKETSPSPTLYSMDKCNPNNTLYIVEGMIDALSVIEVGKYNVVSIPNGANDYKWMEDNADWLDQFDKIVVWFDEDNAGIAARKEVVRRLGIHRASYIEIKSEDIDYINDDGKKYAVRDINEVLLRYGTEKLLWYLDNPVEPEVPGLVNLATVEAFDFENAEGWYTGVGNLDVVMQKWLFGTFTILSGFSGSGKSTFLNQLICEWLNQGFDTFIFSGELPADKLKGWLQSPMAGYDFIDNSNGYKRISSDTVKMMQRWYDGRIHYFDNSVINPSPKEILERIEYLARRGNMRFVVIDSLMCINFDCREDEEHRAHKKFCDDLIALAKKYGLAVILVDHPVKINVFLLDKNNIRGTGHIVNLADYVVIVARYEDEHREGEGRKLVPKYFNPEEYDTVIRIAKNRHGRKRDVELYFDFRSSRLYGNAYELLKTYSWNPNYMTLNEAAKSRPDPNHHGIIREIQ